MYRASDDTFVTGPIALAAPEGAGTEKDPFTKTIYLPFGVYKAGGTGAAAELHLQGLGRQLWTACCMSVC